MGIKEKVSLSIVISTSWVGAVPIWVEKAIQNHERYAKLHNYTYIHHRHNREVITSTPDQVSESMLFAVWQQILDVRAIMEDKSVEYVFKTDLDSIFTNFTKDLSPLKEFKADFIFTGDSNDVCNCGHFLVRNTEWSRNFLDLWLSYRDIIWEDLMTTHQSSDGRLLDQPVLNMLLNKSESLSAANGREAFNAMNGFAGNTERKHKFFSYTHAPTAWWRLKLAASLIDKNLQTHVQIIKQSWFNSYLPGTLRSGSWKRGDRMIHFVGAGKSEMINFMGDARNFRG